MEELRRVAAAGATAAFRVVGEYREAPGRAAARVAAAGAAAAFAWQAQCTVLAWQVQYTEAPAGCSTQSVLEELRRA